MKTDRDLKNDVQDELEWEPSISDPDAIGVAVTDGIVTLTGTVNSFSEKWAAENAAERVCGVMAVTNELEVKVPSDYVRTDADIARAAVDALKWDFNVPEKKVQVEVEDGFVTLKGTVDYQYQKQAAEDEVRYLTGVTGVDNEISVNPPETAGAIKAEIDKAFQRSAQFDASQITVGVSGNKVTLTGQVHSWNERDDAENAAWRAPGVSQVENGLQVTY